jgi:hypothetical protein
MRHHALLIAASLALATSACGQDPVDAAGDYTLSITNRENGCGFDNWTEGESSTGTMISIVQDGAEVSVNVSGFAAVVLGVLQGSSTFQGEVDGDAIDGAIFGSNQLNRDGCPHVVNSTFDAVLDGDVLTGEIRYTVNGNGGPECEALEGCVSRQEFNGTRPPQ